MLPSLIYSSVSLFFGQMAGLQYEGSLPSSLNLSPSFEDSTKLRTVPDYMGEATDVQLSLNIKKLAFCDDIFEAHLLLSGIASHIFQVKII